MVDLLFSGQHHSWVLSLTSFSLPINSFSLRPPYNAIKVFSGVIGAIKEICDFGLKALIAFRKAKYAPIPYINGGSPTAFDLKMARLSFSVFKAFNFNFLRH